MANLTGENGGLDATMLVQPSGGYGYPVYQAAPYYGGGGFGGNGGLFGGDFGALIALFFFAMMFGGFGGGWGMGGGFGGGFEFPWLLASNANNQNATQAGFNNAAITTQLDGIRSAVTDGFSDTQLGIAGVNQNICQSTGLIQNALCQGFAGTTAAVTGAQNAITQQLYGNEIASLNRSYAEQTANAQGFTNLNAGVADLRYTVATEACADRAAVGDALQNVTMQNMGNTNVIVSAIRDGIQSLKDDLCADRLDAERRENQNLRTQLNMATLAASQAAQTAAFDRSLANAENSIYERFRDCPVNTVPVYGSQRIFTCPQNQYNPGCGCNGNFQ